MKKGQLPTSTNGWMSIGLGHSLAVAFNNNRIPGVFHHLSKTEV